MDVTNQKVVAYLEKVKKWKEELSALRVIVLSCNLSEDIKWGNLCYMHNGKNILILYGLKECAAVGFFKGVFLKDKENILLKPGKNTQTGRWIKYMHLSEIINGKQLLIEYIKEAIEIEKARLKLNNSEGNKLQLPIELLERFNEMPLLKMAFEKLTPGRQRAYNIYFKAPVQSSTRITRIEKYIPRILKGQGLNDCVCGLSKKIPTCDGSHKNIPK